MKQLFEIYTDEEILKYYPLLNLEARRMARAVLEIMQKIERIDESTQKEDIDMMYETLQRLLPKQFTSELDKCLCEGCDLDVKSGDMNTQSIAVLTSKLFKLYYEYHSTS